MPDFTAPPADWLSIDDACQRLHVSPRTLRDYAQKGKVKAMRVGKLWRVHRSAIDGETPAPTLSVEPLLDLVLDLLDHRELEVQIGSVVVRARFVAPDAPALRSLAGGATRRDDGARTLTQR